MKAILIGGQYHRTEMFIKHDDCFIVMHKKIKPMSPDMLYHDPNPKHEVCEVLRYHRLGEVPNQEEKTIIYSFDEV